MRAAPGWHPVVVPDIRGEDPTIGRAKRKGVESKIQSFKDITMRGTITFFNSQRGFGFITSINAGETGEAVQQYFFHISNFIKREGEVPVLEGRVRFDVAPPIAVGKKSQAINVQYIHDHLKKSAVNEEKVEGNKSAQ
jgi:cold shock CspA family protein